MPRVLDDITIGATTYSNADYDQDFIIYPNSIITSGNSTQERCDQFNDQIVYVTIDDFTDFVGKRVINEVSNFLSEYHNTYVALPWLSPYADPKADIPIIKGEADNTIASSDTLEDSGIDFVSAGVQIGDLVRNISDTSIGVIDTVGVPDNNTLTVSSLVLGTNNNFSTNDEYYITPQSSAYTTSYLSGTATGGSSTLTLEDTTKDFNEIGVGLGDIIENITNNISLGVVSEVTTNTITVNSLSGGAVDNNFDNGDIYRIRSNMGVITGGGTNTLTDINKNFTTMGVIAGDLIINITDGSFGRVTNVTATTLTVDKMEMGTNNIFSVSDVYRISRYDSVINTPQGLLAFHQPGKYFKSTFDIDWSLTNVTLNTSTGVQTEYQTKVQLDVSASTSTMNISEDEGACVWMTEDHVECYGILEDTDLTVGGIVTSGFNTDTFTDNTQSFISDGVKIGDIIQNFNDEATISTSNASAGSSGTTLVDVGANFTAQNTSGPYELLVLNNTTGIQGVVTQIIDDDTLEVKDYPDPIGPPTGTAISFSNLDSYSLRQPQYLAVSTVVDSDTLTTTQLTGVIPDFDVGEHYRVVPSAKLTSGTINQNCCGWWMRDTSKNFTGEGIEVGDIVENVTTGSFGIISATSGTNWVWAVLYGGSPNSYTNGDTYRIHHGYTSTRKYQFAARFNGGITNPLGKMVYSSTEVRKRGACIGYGTDCLSAPVATGLPYNLDIPMITITDYEDDSDEAATTTAVIPTVGTPTGTIKVSNIDYYLEGNNEIPEWFMRNKWYQYVMVTYSDGDAPGSSPCVAGTDCLTLNIRDSGGTIVNTRDDVRVMVMLSRDELAGQAWTGATVSDYYDNASNTNLIDNDFEKYPQSNTFNDLIRIAVSCPSDNSKLCWSN